MRLRILIVAMAMMAAACPSENNPVDLGSGDTPVDAPKTDGKPDGVKPDAARTDARRDAPGTDAKPDAPTPDIKACVASGASCKASGDCCSGLCENLVCAAPKCKGIGETCAVAGDCCNLNCSGGKCASVACVADKAPCTVGGNPCCSTKCEASLSEAGGYRCTPLNPTCKTAGNPCTGSGECCSSFCKNNICAAPAIISYCNQTGDICYKDAECCTGVCTGASGAKPGTCAAITVSCKVDGTVCQGCGTDCCSTFCAPYGAAGATICQPASGCHVEGDLCQKDSDCCGGDVTQYGKVPGAGLIKCVPDPKYPQIGTCSKPNPGNCPSGLSCNACVPEGDVCHYKGVGGCSSNATRNDCCDATGNKGMCKLDTLGIPRCYGLAACVPAGGDCASAADCCNTIPCVPDASGHLKCASVSCVPQGGTCTTTQDCCTGMPCLVPPGSLQGKCEAPPPPPPPLTEAGVPFPDAGVKKDLPPKVDKNIFDLPKVLDQSKPIDKAIIKPDTAPPPCALYGQACSATVACCANQGTCRNPWPDTNPCSGAGCKCYNPIL